MNFRKPENAASAQKLLRLGQASPTACQASEGQESELEADILHNGEKQHIAAVVGTAVLPQFHALNFPALPV